jgi:UDPglucose 6-dehydrogenase
VTTRVGVVGLSHLGTVAAACLAADGCAVTAVDADAAVVAALTARRPPFHEPGLADLLKRAAPELTTSYETLAACDVVVVACDTVTDDANRADLSVVEAHVDKALPWLAPDAALVLMSQVPVGYTRELGKLIRTRRPQFHGPLTYWVETLVIGEAVARYQKPDRIVLGGPTVGWEPDARLAALVARFRCPVLKMTYESAELTKAAINFYLATSVTFANTLADLCEATGASMRDIVPALRSDPRVGPRAYVRPGLGIGGGNLERDLVHLRDLARRTGVAPGILDTILDASAARYGWLSRAVEGHLPVASGRARLALWGVAYKKDTASTKNAVSLRLIADFGGRVEIVAYDPAAAPPPPVRRAATALEALEGADGLVVLTDWNEFAAVDPLAIRRALRRPVVVDAAWALDPGRVRAAGLTYVGIGEAVGQVDAP